MTSYDYYKGVFKNNTDNIEWWFSYFATTLYSIEYRNPTVFTKRFGQLHKAYYEVKMMIAREALKKEEIANG